MGRAIFESDSEDGLTLDEEGMRLNECYHDKHTGNLLLTYSSNMRRETWNQVLQSGGHIKIERSVRIDKPDSHWLEVPVKASKDWNDFVDSLPKWEDQ